MSSESAIGCTLKNGVEVSLGAPEDIALKEAVALEILNQHSNDVTYINVRLPSKPTYRKAGVPEPSELTPEGGEEGQMESGNLLGEDEGLLSDSYSTGGTGTISAGGSGTMSTGDPDMVSEEE